MTFRMGRITISLTIVSTFVGLVVVLLGSVLTVSYLSSKRNTLGLVAELVDKSSQHAIAELRRVCSSHPQFADDHYNLGLLLAGVGGATQAKMHMERYLELDSASVWAKRSREFIAAL